MFTLSSFFPKENYTFADRNVQSNIYLQRSGKNQSKMKRCDMCGTTVTPQVSSTSLYDIWARLFFYLPGRLLTKTKSGNTSTIKIIHRVNLAILLYLVRDCIGSNQINCSGAEDRMDLARCVIAAVSSGQLVVEENERMVCG
jgi:hypothetical protein